MNVDDIVNATMALPEAERWEVLERLLALLDPEGAAPEWQADGLPEIADATVLVDGDAVVAELQRRLGVTDPEES